jgi:hypothetical protein
LAASSKAAKKLIAFDDIYVNVMICDVCSVQKKTIYIYIYIYIYILKLEIIFDPAKTLFLAVMKNHQK